MPLYVYQARNEQGQRISGTLEAPTEESLEQVLRDRGLYVTTLTATDRAPRTVATPSLTITRGDLILFTVHLGTILSSGIPITSGLKGFADEAPNRRLKGVAESVLDSLDGGASLSEAMARLPRVFPEVYVGLIRAGESIGRVDTVLFELVSLLEWQSELISQLRQASIYPIMLLTGLTGMVILIVTIVMPRFIAALTRAGAPISLSTRIILVSGEIMSQYWLLLLFGLFAGVMVIRWAGTTPRGRYAMDWVKLRIPVFGELVRKVSLSRFAHHLGLLHRAGVDFIVALTAVERVVGNAVLARALAEVRREVLGGSSLAGALRATREFPPLVLQMVATGETSGTLGETLNKVTEYYDREVPAAVKRVTTIIEPLVYVILGSVVLGTALALYSPLLSMLKAIQVKPRF